MIAADIVTINLIVKIKLALILCLIKEKGRETKWIQRTMHFLLFDFKRKYKRKKKTENLTLRNKISIFCLPSFFSLHSNRGEELVPSIHHVLIAIN